MVFKEVQRFRVATEGGKTYEMIERRRIIRTQPISGRAKEALGTKSLRTTCGKNANWIEDGKYQIVETGEIVRDI